MNLVFPGGVQPSWGCERGFIHARLLSSLIGMIFWLDDPIRLTSSEPVFLHIQNCNMVFPTDNWQPNYVVFLPSLSTSTIITHMRHSIVDNRRCADFAQSCYRLRGVWEILENLRPRVTTMWVLMEGPFLPRKEISSQCFHHVSTNSLRCVT